MKTTNSDQKTENRNNSVSKLFTVFLSLVLISFTASANGFWKQLLVNNSNGKMAIMTVDQETKNGELLASTDKTSGGHASEAMSSFNNFYSTTDLDKNLKIENWMTNESYFGESLFNDQPSNEEALEVENWMIANANFGLPVMATETESTLEIEDWMINKSIWAN